MINKKLLKMLRWKHLIQLILGASCFFTFLSNATAENQKIAAWINEVKLGVLYHDISMWSGIRREAGMDFNLEAIFAPHVKFLGGTIRPSIGGSVNAIGDTSKLYSGFRWQFEHASGVFLSLGLGGAVHDGKLHLHEIDRKALGSRVLFHIPVEIGYRVGAKSSLSAYFDHVSNAFLADHNEGMDTIGGRYGYRF